MTFPRSLLVPSSEKSHKSGYAEAGGNKLLQIISTIYQSTQCHIPEECNFHLQTESQYLLCYFMQ